MQQPCRGSRGFGNSCGTRDLPGVGLLRPALRLHTRIEFEHLDPWPRRSPPMRALCWHGKEDVRVDNVPDPKIIDPRDAIVRITATAICGSDLHLYDGYMPTMVKGDIIGHEPMGVVLEVGKEVKKLKPVTAW